MGANGHYISTDDLIAQYKAMVDYHGSNNYLIVIIPLPSTNQNTYFDPGNIGANGEDYTDYDPYKDIAKYKGTTVKFATWINHMETEGADPINSFEERQNYENFVKKNRGAFIRPPYHGIRHCNPRFMR